MIHSNIPGENEIGQRLLASEKGSHRICAVFQRARRQSTWTGELFDAGRRLYVYSR